MPQIIVAADGGDSFGDGAVTLRERVNVEDFESRHFATQLVERIGWAVEDADVAERRRSPVVEDEAVAERRRGPAVEDADVAERRRANAPAPDPVENQRDDQHELADVTVPSPA